VALEQLPQFRTTLLFPERSGNAAQ
jgi:hypothetical protein